MQLGVVFDRDADGNLALGLEAAHSRRRIVHAGGDASGHDIIRTLVRKVYETPSITVCEATCAQRLIVEDNTVRGVVCQTERDPVAYATDHVVIATGGIGGLFLHGTNPAGSCGQGLALAARAGATMADLEFIQFHPTALDTGSFPLKLISEAVRGEGAILIDENGDRFMADMPGAELAPRDVVARAVWRHMAAGHRVFLDARDLRGIDFTRRFPAITSFCRNAGIDPVTQPIPVRPAAHYHMGGIAVDKHGRTSVEGLWACGEAACTGLHGANRLASNSLLEAVVCGGLVAQDIAAHRCLRQAPCPRMTDASAGGDPTLVRPILSRAAGVLRDGDKLACSRARAVTARRLAAGRRRPAIVALMIVIAALRREETRGAHARTDFPERAIRATRTTCGFATRLTPHKTAFPIWLVSSYARTHDVAPPLPRIMIEPLVRMALLEDHRPRGRSHDRCDRAGWPPGHDPCCRPPTRESLPGSIWRGSPSNSSIRQSRCVSSTMTARLSARAT